MSKHTPGPWEVQRFRDSGFRGISIKAASGYIANIVFQPGDENELANARLIAAAPAMHDYISRRAEGGDVEARSILEARIAITKAEGRS